MRLYFQEKVKSDELQTGWRGVYNFNSPVLPAREVTPVFVITGVCPAPTEIPAPGLIPYTILSAVIFPDLIINALLNTASTLKVTESCTVDSPNTLSVETPKLSVCTLILFYNLFEAKLEKRWDVVVKAAVAVMTNPAKIVRNKFMLISVYIYTIRKKSNDTNFSLDSRLLTRGQSPFGRRGNDRGVGSNIWTTRVIPVKTGIQSTITIVFFTWH